VTEAFVIGVTFLVAGFVKGTVGIGLPTISVAVLTTVIGLEQAIAVSLLPSLASNVWQSVNGGAWRRLTRRLYPFLVPAVLTIWLGVMILRNFDLETLSSILGLVLVLYSGANLFGLRLTLSRDQERWIGPAFGALNGILAGMTGSYVVPGAMFLQAIGLGRDELVQAMGILFTLSTIALALLMSGSGMLSVSNTMISLAVLVPVMIGMIVGQRVRERFSEKAFRRATMGSLLVLGLYLVISVAT
jgi:uncharacterized membrane protein YfcA